MAEFVEVMRQVRRICEMEECRKCPLYNFSAGDCMMTLSYSCETDVDYGEAEKIILQWAKENPEPVYLYPSWAEGWEQLYPSQNGFLPTAVDCMCPAYFGEKYRDKQCSKITCSVCRSDPIPADIAKKLGIKPKEQPC